MIAATLWHFQLQPYTFQIFHVPQVGNHCSKRWHARTDFALHLNIHTHIFAIIFNKFERPVFMNLVWLDVLNVKSISNKMVSCEILAAIFVFLRVLIVLLRISQLKNWKLGTINFGDTNFYKITAGLSRNKIMKERVGAKALLKEH